MSSVASTSTSFPPIAGINNSSETNKVLVGDFYRRDGQQSTIAPKDMVWNLADLTEVSLGAAKAGIDYEETNGGNFPSAALQNGINAFRINQQVHEIVKNKLDQENLGHLAPFSSVLFRGKSTFSLSTFSPDFIEAAFIHTIKKAGNRLIRVFDGLNDANSMVMTDKMLEVAKEHGANIQGSLCTGPSLKQIRETLGDAQVDKYLEKLSDEQKQAYNNVHTNQYYINYAKELVKKGFDSIVIKDLSGVFDPERIKEFIPELKSALKELQRSEADKPNSKVKQHDIPIYLHYHSSNLPQTKKVMAAAIDSGIDAIDTANGPLGDGTAHIRLDSLDAFNEGNSKIKVDKASDAYSAYKKILERVAGKSAKKRLDNFGSQTDEMLEKFDHYFFAGGAAASGIANAKKLSGISPDTEIDESNIGQLSPMLDMKLVHSAWMHLLMGMPPEVTPIPKIKTVQATQNLLSFANGNNAGRDVLDVELFKNGFSEDTVKYLNGHYGKVNAYISQPDGSIKTVALEPLPELKQVFKDTLEGNGASKFAQKVTQQFNEKHPDLKGIDVLDAYKAEGKQHLEEAKQKAQNLVDQYGIVAKSFGSDKDIAILAQQAQMINGQSTIDTAMQEHSTRVDKIYKEFTDEYLTKNQTQALAVIPNFKYLIAPLFEYFDAMVKVGAVEKNANFLDMQISEFGGTTKDQVATYEHFRNSLGELGKKLPIVGNFESYSVKGLIDKVSEALQTKELQRIVQKEPHLLNGLAEAKKEVEGLATRAAFMTHGPDATTEKNARIINQLHQKVFS